MLSYKLKHLCSQMFASLAAFGLFSLGGGEARADVQSPESTFNFVGRTESFTVAATYADECGIPDGFKGISSAEFVTGGSGSGYCKYTCKDKYYYQENNTGVASMTGITGGSGSATKFIAPGDCYPMPDSCITGLWEGTGIYIKQTTEETDIEFATGLGYYCVAKCKDGFVSSTDATKDYAQSSYATSTAALTVPACEGKNFTMTVNCGSGNYDGTSSSTGNVTVRYGTTIKLPGSEQCVWPGHTLKGYDVPSSAIKK